MHVYRYRPWRYYNDCNPYWDYVAGSGDHDFGQSIDSVNGSLADGNLMEAVDGH